ncbi:anti-sigma factor domain-containing protein [Gottschalkia purinilytica]|nr:anti-sigma factor domain-containing protein [Gottschalkia purinilytica]
MKTKKGIVMESNKNYIVVLTDDGQFVKLRAKNNPPKVGEIYIGKEVTSIRKFVSVASILFCLLFGTGVYAYNTPTSSIIIGNSSDIKIEVNMFNRIIKTTPLNDKGNEILKSVNVKHKPIDKGIKIIDSKNEKNSTQNKNNPIKKESNEINKGSNKINNKDKEIDYKEVDNKDKEIDYKEVDNKDKEIDYKGANDKDKTIYKKNQNSMVNQSNKNKGNIKSKDRKNPNVNSSFSNNNVKQLEKKYEKSKSNKEEQKTLKKQYKQKKHEKKLENNQRHNEVNPKSQFINHKGVKVKKGKWNY